MKGLRPSVPTTLFRRVEQILRGDEDLGAVVDSWKPFFGADESGTPPPEGKVEISLFPYLRGEGGQARFTPSSDRVELHIDVTMGFSTRDAGSYMDVWFAVQRAIFPVDKVARNRILVEILQPLHSLSEPLFIPPTPDMTSFSSEHRFDVTGTIVLAHVEINRNPD